ncbi:hypothetical protein JQX13_22705 [Archangium violaceum]|uniref:DUF6484 domain-containing protein n=1 Tax=Archangium violaceum TaxID=83451 RepID=UPI00193BE045|nr:DUF6484 domain-containing protein [Archangium violaceum]QRK12589.1 hypothetical protein JQX13_22705 [Archangium violaceum]
MKTDDTQQPGGPAVLEPILAPRQGWVAGLATDGGVLVDFPGNSRGPVGAKLGLPLDARAVREAVARRQPVMLLFEEGDPRRPFLLAFVYTPSPTPMLDSLLENTATYPPEHVKVDGQRMPLKVKGRSEVSFSCGDSRVTLTPNELSLVCGEASLTLQRNGRAVLRGVRVESRAEDVNRIKGGAVEVN